jgi:hypothetical protein
MMEQQINLYHERFHFKKAEGPGIYFWAAIGVVSLLILLAVGTHWQGAKLDKELARVTALYQERQKEMDEVQLAIKQRGKSPVLLQEIVTLEKELRRQEKTLEYFEGAGHAANKLGFSSYLDALASIDRKEIWLDQIDIQSGGSKVTLRGMTLDPRQVPVYLQDLGTFPAFMNKSFSSFVLLQEQDAESVHRFLVSSEPGAELAQEVSR